MPVNSIDGYGLQFQHLTEEGRDFLRFAMLKKIELEQTRLAEEQVRIGKGLLTDEQRQAIGASYRAAKAKLDKSQQDLLEAITTTPKA